ncbi:branched-chain amino acid ABC transporter permease [Haladaptatus caseinilyticus]|uniref:branched-chain amino acid ABC transporter permease n=1 Tax=Haladaptatus caseinilyticus TaxID=2993314 RepID=UPI00224B374E|nr:branched-chain amino acid ABC transporter permease [Haladaptatus caseinilyticus]
MGLVSALLTGILIGLIYALIASSLNIIFGVMRIVNFAHGNFIILASFMTFWLWKLYSIKPLSSIVIVAPIFFVIGIGLYYLTVPRLLNADDTESMSLLAYFGLSIVMMAAMRIFWGAQSRGIPSPYEGTFPLSVTVGGMRFATGRLIGAGVAVVLLLSLLWFLYNTYYGKAMRAMIQNRDATKFLGINTHRVSALSFGIAMALAGITGCLLTLIFPAFSATAGEHYTLIAFAIIVLGGLGDPIGAMVGGVFFAIVEQVSMVYLPPTASPMVAFLVLLAVIMVKNDGLFTVEDLRAIRGQIRSTGESKS